MESGFIRVIKSVHALLPPEPLQRRHHKIKVAVDAVVAHLAHFDGVGNRIQYPNGSFVGAALLVGIAHAPNRNVIHRRHRHDLGLVLWQVEFFVFFLIIKSHSVYSFLKSPNFTG